MALPNVLSDLMIAATTAALTEHKCTSIRLNHLRCDALASSLHLSRLTSSRPLPNFRAGSCSGSPLSCAFLHELSNLICWPYVVGRL
ncbi:hypothetical protein BD779DRAFT_304442 [Infundibulicybe gibba]|nr:hypothetical protein BD779DRAFT_304442 [Infundibulicybe gibba]